MKTRKTNNRIDSGSHKRLKAVVALVVLVALVTGLAVGYGALRDLCIERSMIRDMSEQVRIDTGKMVRAENIAEHFGLKKGAYLAKIDFRAKRKELLDKVPTLKSISVRRILPDKVAITAEERTPIARLNLRGNNKVTGRVVDADGVVFMCQRGTQMLPTIREASAPGTQPGHTLKGQSGKALELIVLCRESDYLSLGILEVDASRPDFLTMTLGDYSIAKICWTDHQDLTVRLEHLMTAIRSQIGTGVKTWNATMPDKIFADTQEKL